MKYSTSLLSTLIVSLSLSVVNGIPVDTNDTENSVNTSAQYAGYNGDITTVKNENQTISSSLAQQYEKDLGIPSNSLNVNGIPFGFLPDYDFTLADIDDIIGHSAAALGGYTQITSSYWDGSQLTRYLDELLAKPGAIFMASIMPTDGFTLVDDKMAQKIAAVAKKFTDNGIYFWLRFGHEVNWYVADGTYHGTSSEYKEAWKKVANAVKDNSKVKMYWSPNQSDEIELLDEWWPGEDTVDIVGIDIYPKDRSKNAVEVFQPFYNRFAEGYNKPFAIGETGVTTSDPDFKAWWFKSVTSTTIKNAFPRYILSSWFEYNKEGVDFRLIQDTQTRDKVLSFFSS